MRYVAVLPATCVLLSALLAACASTEVDHVFDPKALGPYSAAVEAGDVVYLAGKVGRDRRTFATEAASAIDAVERELDALDLTLADVVSTTVYLTDIEDYQPFNEIYSARFPAPYPARACVAVQALPGGARVEIQATAVRR